MKATGIVRRIDDLGRVVIPKEIRRTMRIREGDPLEIFTDREGEVIFKKYSPVGEINAFAEQYAETLHKTCDLSVLICDRDGIVASSGVPKREFTEKRISEDLEDIIERRVFYKYATGGRKVLPTTDGASYYATCIMPIVSNGDASGCVISLERSQIDRLPNETEVKLVQTAAGFLGRQFSQ